MPILQIKVEKKMFVECKGVDVQTFRPYYIEADGWKCHVYTDGNISCIATENYDGVEHEIKFSIKNNYLKLVLKIGDEPEKVLKCHEFARWTGEGVLNLSGGYIDNRRVIAREIEFQDFLDKYGITKVRYETANAVYKLTRKLQVGEILQEETVETDGVKELIRSKFNAPKKSNHHTKTVFDVVRITNANWAIKTTRNLDGVEQRVLYTTEKYQNLTGLPKSE